jgi:hypothetical protein
MDEGCSNDQVTMQMNGPPSSRIVVNANTRDGQFCFINVKKNMMRAAVREFVLPTHNSVSSLRMDCPPLEN